MPFCADCPNRSARCVRQCRLQAEGEHLWNVMQEELMRDRPTRQRQFLAFDRQPDDVQRAYIVGAQAMREMAR